MSDDQKGNEQNNSAPKQEGFVSGKISVEFDSEPIRDIANAINKKEFAPNEKDENGNSVAIRQANAQERANRISNKLLTGTIFSFGVNAMILIVYIAIYFATKDTNAISAGNLRLADAAFKQSRIDKIKYDSLDSVKTAKNRYDDNIKFKKQFDQQERSLETQIKSIRISDSNYKKSTRIQDSILKVNNESLENQTEPYIFIEDYKSDTIRPKSKLDISITIKNFGKSIAEIFYYKTKIEFRPSENSVDFSFDPDHIYVQNILLEPSEPKKIYFPQQNVGSYYDSYNFHYGFFFIMGQVVYSNVFKKKVYAYNFCYRMDEFGVFFPTFKHNGIVETKIDSLPIKNGLNPYIPK